MCPLFGSSTVAKTTTVLVYSPSFLPIITIVKQHCIAIKF